MERTISFMNGKGSIGHNTRSFIADNVDARRRKMILPLSCVGTGLTGRRKTRTISIYPYWIIRSRSGQRKWLFLRRN